MKYFSLILCVLIVQLGFIVSATLDLEIFIFPYRNLSYWKYMHFRRKRMSKKVKTFIFGLKTWPSLLNHTNVLFLHFKEKKKRTIDFPGV